MLSPEQTQLPTKDPVGTLAEAPGDSVLAVITRIKGPSYRPLGACMGILQGVSVSDRFHSFANALIPG